MTNGLEQFFSPRSIAVVGASQDREKYGNKVLRAYKQNELDAVPINPSVPEVEGLKAYPDLSFLPDSVDAVSIITPPKVTEKIVKQAIELGIKNIWMQPGAESEDAIQTAERSGANVIAGGPCLLVALRFRDN